ncbi:hypothetical protein ACWC6I_32560 [Streptomyces sp. NPDC001414]
MIFALCPDGWGGKRGKRGVERIPALPERECQLVLHPWALRSGEDTPRSLIEGEIVIVDDDGTEEPFDPVSWFS